MRMTPLAHEKISEFLADVDDSRLRVAQLASGGCCGGKIKLGVTLDDSLEDEDEIITVDGIEVVIERALHKNLGAVLIDFDPQTGIVVRAEGGSNVACPQRAAS